MNTYNSLIDLYLKQASQSLSEVMNIFPEITKRQGDWNLLNVKENHIKSMIDLYSQQKNSVGYDYRILLEVEKLRNELLSISFQRNQIKTNLEYLFNRAAYLVSNSLSRVIEATSLAAQSNNEIYLINIRGIMNSISRVIDQARTIHPELYNGIVTKCQNSINIYSLSQIQSQNSFYIVDIISKIRQIINANLIR